MPPRHRGRQEPPEVVPLGTREDPFDCRIPGRKLDGSPSRLVCIGDENTVQNYAYTKFLWCRVEKLCKTFYFPKERRFYCSYKDHSGVTLWLPYWPATTYRYNQEHQRAIDRKYREWADSDSVVPFCEIVFQYFWETKYSWQRELPPPPQPEPEPANDDDFEREMDEFFANAGGDWPPA